MASNETVTPSKQESRPEAIAAFAGTNAPYYQQQFDKLDDAAGFAFSFNQAAAVLGPFWWVSRHLWTHFWIFLFLETVSIVHICQGLFAELGHEEFARAKRLANSAVTRTAEAEEAVQNGADSADALRESAVALDAAASRALAGAEETASQGPVLVAVGVGMLLVLKFAQGSVANQAMKTRFQNWRADRTMAQGIVPMQTLLMSLFTGLVVTVSTFRFTTTTVPSWLKTVPVDKQWRRNVETVVDNGFQQLTESFSGLFGGITRTIRLLLDGMETVMVGTPWPVMMAVIILLAYRLAGSRVAIFTAVALAYLGILGFWEKSMLTVALLGSACVICLIIGIPLGILCARKEKIRAFMWPVLDLMQTIPSFVYLIPVIAFFGIGKPPGVIATIVFGMPPVVRLTLLGMRGVPSSVREAAEAFGASKMYLLFKVDLPLAKPSIMAGVNQTILMCLSMVVIASLIGAKGLGEDVLDALTYANEGKGVLAGVAILFCAMVLDRIVQGKQAGSTNKKV